MSAVVAEDVAQAISFQSFVNEDVLSDVTIMATKMLGGMMKDPAAREQIKTMLLDGMRAAQEQLPALIQKIEAL